VSFAPGLLSPNAGLTDNNTIVSGFSQSEFDDAVGRVVDRHIAGNITQMQGLMSSFQQQMKSTLQEMKDLKQDSRTAHHKADGRQQL
jgi:hypothetical protein